MPNFISKNSLAEFLGTFMLVFIGVGAARTLGPSLGEASAAASLAIAFAFGIAVMMGAYSLGRFSGCHFNPAVSIGAWAAGQVTMKELIEDVIAQVAGAVAAAFLLTIMLAGLEGTGSGANSYGEGSFHGINFLRAAVFEFVATAIFVFVILGIVSQQKQAIMAGLIIGLALTAIHVVGITLTGVSVNPARSIGPALFAGEARAIGHLWVFIVFPAAGGLVAGLIWRTLFAGTEEAELS